MYALHTEYMDALYSVALYMDRRGRLSDHLVTPFGRFCHFRGCSCSRCGSWRTTFGRASVVVDVFAMQIVHFEVYYRNIVEDIDFEVRYAIQRSDSRRGHGA